jgi:hypothetical protein
MREYRSYGSVRGALGNWRPYRDRIELFPVLQGIPGTSRGGPFSVGADNRSQVVRRASHPEEARAKRRATEGSLTRQGCSVSPDASTKETVAVGTPVTQRPPHGSVRAVFPHTALTSDG